ncbi:hypothetical protein [Endozoicomonas sp. YOMI1]|uniref:hypothetical protein n=1 Tax=Endozoicomonas sp. YOMI1 TaxID=2828739 RepID=UPI002147592F|nr:hypothetical protein [Endozoicomonas sp. YOMI1]
MGLHPYEASASQYKASVANPGREGPFPYQVREFRDEPENTSTTAAVNVSAPQTLKQWSSGPDFPDNPIPRLNALTLKTLNIIQEINGSYTDPLILITGSYSRFLQNLCSLFNNDIDIICTTEESARTLFAKLQALNINGRDSGIPKSITIWPIRGCQAIKLPNAYNIQLNDADLGMKAMGLQVSVDNRVAQGNAARLAVRVPGVERPVWCLSFAEETRLLNDTLEYLADHLDPLTEQLQKEQQRLHGLTEHLQMKLTGHVCRHDFEYRVNGWLSTTQPVNGYEIKRKDFIKALLEMINPEAKTTGMKMPATCLE